MTGFIGVGQLKYILTNLGEKMSEDEVDELLKAVDTSSGQVNYTGRRHLSGNGTGSVSLTPRPNRARSDDSLQLKTTGGWGAEVDEATATEEGIAWVS